VIPNPNEATNQNLEIQKSSLQIQLANLKQTYEITSENFNIQIQNAKTQTNDSQDLIDQNIQSFKSQQQILINDAFKKIDNSSRSTKNTSLYDDLYSDHNDVENMSNDQLSNYLQDMSDLMNKATKYAS